MKKLPENFGENYDFDSMPDPGKLLAPARPGIEISKVGIRKFQSPIDLVRKDGQIFRAKGTFSSYCSLEPHLKGTHLSRMTIGISETTYNKPITTSSLSDITEYLMQKLETDKVYLKMKFDYPLKQESLKSVDKKTGKKLFGWMYYPSIIEIKQEKGQKARAYYTIKYTFASVCPCSQLLSKSLTEQTGHPAHPHMQKSEVETTVEVDLDSDYHIEDLIQLHRDTITTEVLGSPVKRVDEMYFAGLLGMQDQRDINSPDSEMLGNNGNALFVEDSVRHVHDALDKDKRIKAFRAIAEHFESLHPFSVTAVSYKDESGVLK